MAGWMRPPAAWFVKTMRPLSSTVRTNNFSDLQHNHFDVLVIGGGVTGAGVALDAVARGYKVALIEKKDFASGTSSKSTKLVHGGIRYLPEFDFSLVHEALVERGLLLQNAPYLVQPVEFVLPIYKGDRHPVGMPFTTPGGVGLSQLLNIGLSLYDIMAGRRNIRWHRHISRDKVMELAPALVTDGLKEGFIYYDAQTNDARLTLALIRTAAQYGATITNYTEAVSFLEEKGRVTGVTVRDRFSNQEVVVRARHVVTATATARANAACYNQGASLGPYALSRNVYLLPSHAPWLTTTSLCHSVNVKFSQLTAPIQMQVCFITDTQNCNAWTNITATNQWYQLIANAPEKVSYRFGIKSAQNSTIQFTLAG